MLPDPNSITVEQAPDAILFPRDEIDRIFYRGHDKCASALFGPMWEYKDVLYDTPFSPHDPSHIGLIMGTDRETIARLRHLNELSFESARRRATEKQGILSGPGRPFINGAILSSIFNYIPWKAFLKKLDEYILPGGLLVVYNAQEGERAHLDWKNIAEDQETIAAFIKEDLRYAVRIHELRKDFGKITPLYLVAQKQPNK